MTSKEAVRYYRRPELPEVELLSVDGWGRPMSFYLTSFMVAYVRQSSSTIQVGPDQRRAVDRAVHIFEPENLFRHLDISRPETVRVAYLPDSHLDKLVGELDVRSRPRYVSPDGRLDPELVRAFDRFHRCVERPESASLEIEARYLQAVRTMLKVISNSCPVAVPRHEPAAVRRTRDQIHDRCGEKLTLTELAKGTGLSRYQLFRAFARETGVPPHAYQLSVRLERAKGLLLQGTPPAHVAADLGFYDQSHFTQCFRTRLGVTPLEYVG